MNSAAVPSRKQRTDIEQHALRRLPALAVISLIAGAATGLLGGAFRKLLEHADVWRGEFLDRMHAGNWAGLPCVIIVCAGSVAMAAWLVRRYSPYASGSGIPHVEAVLSSELPPAPPQLIAVKFIGGLLSMGSGLALGREGPSVQMGASLSHLIGKIFRRDPQDCLLLLAAGAGAGLSVAFNAPIAGAAFVLEELTRRFDTRITIVTFGASAGAIGIGRWVFGNDIEFPVSSLSYDGIKCLPVSLVLGIVTGFLGIAYNQAIVKTLQWARSLRWPVEARAALIGASAGLLAWFAPTLVGGGDLLVQHALSGTAGSGLIIGVFLLRFALGPISYAAGTPGGLFAPMLVLGAQSGLLFGNLTQVCFPSLVTDPVTYAVTGTAAFFAAVVRAPLTGIILVIELTGSYTLLLPMLAASFTAMLIPTLFRNPPIYDSLAAKK